MQNRLKTRKLIARIVFDAMMIAVYVVFAAILTFKTPFFEVSMVGVPILLSAKLFGIGDAIAIATIGSFIEQAVSQYGLSVTTPLWMAPLMIMAVCAGTAFYLTRNMKNKAVILIVIIISELVLTVCNTAALYLDGYIWDYSVKALHLIAVPRLINSGVRMIVSCILLPALLPPLKKILK